jgi:hypothetical protein
MSYGSPQRRRWLIRLLAIGVLLAGMPLAWRYRPMSESESLLVGSWRALGDDPVSSRLKFLRGRRLMANGGPDQISGSWHVSGGKLYVSYDLPFPQTWGEASLYLQQIISRDHGLDFGPIDLRFEGTTRVRCRYRREEHGDYIDEVLERVP